MFIFYFRDFLISTEVCVCVYDKMITLHLESGDDLTCVCFCYVSHRCFCVEKSVLISKN